MKERPILFSAPMVRALLDGSKTQTRRICKLPFRGSMPEPEYESFLQCCPYGQPGDRLWVRETWQYYDWTEDGEPFIRYAADNATSLKNTSDEKIVDIWEALSRPENFDIDNRARDRRWRPSIHMFRWASRITLEIVSVRVERLQDISDADAIAEGIDLERLAESQDSYDIIATDGNMTGRPTAVSYYRDLWLSINGAGSWEANPFCWVIEFKRMSQ